MAGLFFEEKHYKKIISVAKEQLIFIYIAQIKIQKIEIKKRYLMSQPQALVRIIYMKYYI